MTAYFLPSTNDLTDRTAEILQLLTTYGFCQLGNGTYVVSGLDMPEGTTLSGVGYATCLVLPPEVTQGYTVRLTTHCMVKDLHLSGGEGSEIPSQLGTRHGLAFLGTATPQNRSGQPMRASIRGCVIENFSGGGITCTDTGYNTQCSMTVSDCHIHRCGAGINISHFSEYHRFTNMHCTHCLYGCINNGGNNVFVNCGFDSNGTGFLIDNSQGQSINNSHGSAVGCTFNHTGGNGGIGIQILGAKSGYSFTGCQLFFSHIVLEDSEDIHFTGLNTGRQVEISVTGGKLTMFTGCSFGNPPDAIRIKDNDLVKFINCFTRDGEPVGI